METRLNMLLAELDSALRGARLRRRLACCWAVTAAAGLALYLAHRATGWDSRPAWWLVLAGGLLAAVIVRWRERRRPVDFRAVVDRLEREDPQLRHLLSAAAEQEPDPHSGQFGYLQLRVIEEVLLHRDRLSWEQRFQERLSYAVQVQMLALAALVGVFCLESGLTPWHTGPVTPWVTGRIRYFWNRFPCRSRR